jgi:hypothetical protein
MAEAATKHRFFYLRDKDKFPVACVASITNNTDRVQFALSIHNPRDIFDKTRAKEIALDRLRMGKTTGEVEFDPRPGIKTRIMGVIATTEFMNHRAKPMRIPDRVRRAAREWLLERGV